MPKSNEKVPIRSAKRCTCIGRNSSHACRQCSVPRTVPGGTLPGVPRGPGHAGGSTCCWSAPAWPAGASAFSATLDPGRRSCGTAGPWRPWPAATSGTESRWLRSAPADPRRTNNNNRSYAAGSATPGPAARRYSGLAYVTTHSWCTKRACCWQCSETLTRPLELMPPHQTDPRDTRFGHSATVSSSGLCGRHHRAERFGAHLAQAGGPRPRHTGATIDQSHDI